MEVLRPLLYLWLASLPNLSDPLRWVTALGIREFFGVSPEPFGSVERMSVLDITQRVSSLFVLYRSLILNPDVRSWENLIR